MQSRNEDPGQGPDVGDVLSELGATFRRNAGKLGPILLVVLTLVVIYLGVFKVDPGAQGVVRRFGQMHRIVDPGLRFAVPFIERVDVVNMEEVRRAEVGFRGDKGLPAEALMLTGDENIVEVRMAVQYRVADPVRFLFRIAEPEETLHTAAEVAIRTVVGQTKIDEVMTRGRGQVQTDTRALLQSLMAEYESGIEITEVKLHSVDAPDEVKDAFNAVTRAREDREKLVNQAQGYAEDKLPRARGEARGIEREAEAYKEQRVLRAKGDVAKFEALLTEYEKAKQVTRHRLYLETVERVMNNVGNKVVLDGRMSNTALPIFSLGNNSITPPAVPTATARPVVGANP